MVESRRNQQDVVAEIAVLAARCQVSVGVAESLTGGRISAALASGNDASDWFRGGVVAYAPAVKFDLLDVTRGPVNTARCAIEMAVGATRTLNSDIAVSATGVGGPGTDEGVPAGTVFIGCCRRGHDVALGEHHLDGEPPEIVGQTVELALQSILKALREIR